jgi:C-terminal processing protease CtpA/Prc
VAFAPGVPARRAAEPWVRFTIDKEHDLAVLTLDKCVADKTYLEKLKELFGSVHVQGIGRVAIDVRGNRGGNSAVVDELLRYIDVESYSSPGAEVRSSAAASGQRGFVAALPRSTGVPVRRNNARHAEPPPFGGQLFVLTGKHTFSSGNWFAVVLQDNAIAKVVGEPTGNAPSSFGDILSFTLPESGLSFTLSFKRWYRPDPARDPADCVVPDVLVPVTRRDLVEGRDPVLEHLRQTR